MRRSYFIIILLCHSFAPSQSAEESGDRIKWQDLRNLTLQSGQVKTVKFGKPVPQVQCDECMNTFGEGTGDCECRIRSVTCTSQGIRKNSQRYPPLNWKCTSETTPADHTLVVTGVTCDCFTDCRDDNIRISSCSLTYSLTSLPWEQEEVPLERSLTKRFIDWWWNWCLRSFTELFGKALGFWAACIAMFLTFVALLVACALPYLLLRKS